MYTTVDVIVTDATLEAIALRSFLEYLGVRCRMHWIGQPADVLKAIEAVVPRPGCIVFCGHGDENGFTLPELHESLRARQPFNDHLSPEIIRERFDLSDCLVLSTACRSGEPRMGSAMLAAGAVHYLAPVDYPDGNAALYYAISFFYGLFQLDLTVAESHLRAGRGDEDTGLFRHLGGSER